jgi:hypothetical protein
MAMGRSPLALAARARHQGQLGIVVAVGATLVCAGALVPNAGARPRLSCSTLEGKQLASTAKIKVVEQATESRGTAYVCAPPKGRVRVAGHASSFGGSEYSIKVAAKAGSWVALEFDSVLGVPGEEVGKAFNAANGKSYRYWHYETDPMAKPEEVRTLDRVLLNRFGGVALAERKGNTERIVGIEPNGTRHVLDSGPSTQIAPGSLKLAGTKAEWVDGGTTRSASI